MIFKFHYRPEQIIKFIDSQLTKMVIFTVVLLLIGLWFSFFGSPTDYHQGETVRIMYIHVPCSWGAMGMYFLMAAFSIYAFVKQVPFIHIVVKSMAPIGLCLCLISLATGSIWGKPTWGTWWVWDARLTSMFILALLYSVYLLLVTKTSYQAERTASFIVIIGSLNLPIIKWSVEWWNTLHQPASVLRFAKPAIHWQLLIPLFIMAFSLATLSITLFLIRLRSELNYRRLLASQIRGYSHATN